MNPKWYISQARNGGPASPEKIPAKVVGPLSAAALLELASVGGVGAGDLLLMEGTDVHITLEQFLQMTRSGSPPGGAAAVPVAPPCPPPAPTADNAVPNWLADVRQLEWAPNTKVPDVVSWLEDIRHIEESLRRTPAPSDIPLATPVTAAAPATVPVAPPVARQEQRGYDPETGQILDAVAYARWQKAQAERRDESQEPCTPSVAEVFLQAQRAIQEWVDTDANKTLVLTGTRYEIRHCPTACALVRRFDAFGPVMQAKLWTRLFFLVDNRKKYYQATR